MTVPLFEDAVLAVANNSSFTAFIVAGSSVVRIISGLAATFSPRLLKVPSTKLFSAVSRAVLEKTGLEVMIVEYVVADQVKVCEAEARANPSPVVTSTVIPSLSTYEVE